MVNYKPTTKQTRLDKYLDKHNEFIACTQTDHKVLIAMQDPSYKLVHNQAILNFK